MSAETEERATRWEVDAELLPSTVNGRIPPPPLFSLSLSLSFHVSGVDGRDALSDCLWMFFFVCLFVCLFKGWATITVRVGYR